MHVVSVHEKSLAAEGHQYTQKMSSPTPFNLILWQTLAVDDSTVWLGSYSLLDSDNQIEFETLPRNLDRLDRWEETWEISKLKQFAKGFHIMLPGEELDMFVDMRFGSIDRGPGYPPGYVFSFEIPHNYTGDVDSPPIARRPPDFEGAPNAIYILWNRLLGD